MIHPRGCDNAAGYNRTLEPTLLRPSANIANEVLEHRVEIWFDVWWRLSSHSIPLAGDLHVIVSCGRYDLEPVAEVNAESVLQKECLNATEHNRAVELVLIRDSTCIAGEVVGHRVEMWFHSWCHIGCHYVPVASDLFA